MTRTLPSCPSLMHNAFFMGHHSLCI
jgi:hypothetical protein